MSSIYAVILPALLWAQALPFWGHSVERRHTVAIQVAFVPVLSVGMGYSYRPSFGGEAWRERGVTFHASALTSTGSFGRNWLWTLSTTGILKPSEKWSLAGELAILIRSTSHLLGRGLSISTAPSLILLRQRQRRYEGWGLGLEQYWAGYFASSAVHRRIFEGLPGEQPPTDGWYANLRTRLRITSYTGWHLGSWSILWAGYFSPFLPRRGPIISGLLGNLPFGSHLYLARNF